MGVMTSPVSGIVVPENPQQPVPVGLHVSRFVAYTLGLLGDTVLAFFGNDDLLVVKLI